MDLVDDDITVKIQAMDARQTVGIRIVNWD